MATLVVTPNHGMSGLAPRLYLDQINGNNGFKIFDPLTPMGNKVSGVGDFNNDGIDDILINANPSPYLILGQNGNFTHPFDINTLDGSNGTALVLAEYLFSFHSFGDINSDGINDISFKFYNQNNLVVFGQAAPLDATTVISSISDENKISITKNGMSSFSISLSNIGDINGDGFDDLSIVDEDYAPEDINCYYKSEEALGANYIILGGTTLPQTIEINDLDQGVVENYRLIGQDRQGFTGGEGLNRTTKLGDINGDGIDDFGLTSGGSGGCKGYYGDYGFYRGNTYIIFGNNNPTSLPASTDSISAEQGFVITRLNEQFRNFKIYGLGDINGDGINDIGTCGSLLCAVIYSKDEPFNEAFNVSSINAQNGFHLIADNSGTRTPYLLQSDQFSDFNGDHIQDLVFVNSYFDNIVMFYGNKANNKRTHLVSEMAYNEAKIISISSTNPNIVAQTASSHAGDVNNDGLEDLIVGWRTGDSGYVIYGDDLIFESSLENIE